MQVEFVIRHAVQIVQEDSVGLRLGIDGIDQTLLQVIKRLKWLSFTQGSLIHLNATVHQALLFRSKL